MKMIEIALESLELRARLGEPLEIGTLPGTDLMREHVDLFVCACHHPMVGTRMCHECPEPAGDIPAGERFAPERQERVGVTCLGIASNARSEFLFQCLVCRQRQGILLGRRRDETHMDVELRQGRVGPLGRPLGDATQLVYREAGPDDRAMVFVREVPQLAPPRRFLDRQTARRVGQLGRRCRGGSARDRRARRSRECDRRRREHVRFGEERLR